MKKPLLCFALVFAFNACGAPPPSGGAVLPNALGQTIRPDRGAKSTLLYASDANDNLVYMIDLPSGRLAGKLTGFDQPTGLCADVKGDVYVVSSQASEILAYKHAVKSAFKELGDHPYIPVGCSIDPVTGNLALANCCGNSPDGNLAIYAHATGAAKYFSDPSMYIYWYCAYDDRGNLYVSGINHSYAYQLDVMPAGKHALNAVMLSPNIEGDVSPALQWDGKYLAIASPTAGAIWQYAVNGTQAKRVHVTKLSDAGGVLDFWIAATSQRRTLYAPILANSALSIGVYPYPKGGKPETKLYDAIDPYAVTVSAPP